MIKEDINTEKYYSIDNNTSIKHLKEIYKKIDMNNPIQLLDENGNLIDRSQANIYKLIKNIFSKMNIKLNINGKIISAEFSSKSASKNAYGNNSSDAIGKKYKNEHIEELPYLIANSMYASTSLEKGEKNTGIHANTTEWHYFVNDIITEYGEMDIKIRISYTGNKHYVYDVSYRMKKIKPTGN